MEEKHLKISQDPFTRHISRAALIFIWSLSLELSSFHHFTSSFSLLLTSSLKSKHIFLILLHAKQFGNPLRCMGSCLHHALGIPSTMQAQSLRTVVLKCGPRMVVPASRRHSLQRKILPPDSDLLHQELWRCAQKSVLTHVPSDSDTYWSLKMIALRNSS